MCSSVKSPTTSSLANASTPPHGELRSRRPTMVYPERVGIPELLIGCNQHGQAVEHLQARLQLGTVGGVASNIDLQNCEVFESSG
eukprot:7124117-Alexandrium_andersonii.AAC.1